MFVKWDAVAICLGMCSSSSKKHQMNTVIDCKFLNISIYIFVYFVVHIWKGSLLLFNSWTEWFRNSGSRAVFWWTLFTIAYVFKNCTNNFILLIKYKKRQLQLFKTSLKIWINKLTTNEQWFIKYFVEKDLRMRQCNIILS